MNKKADIGPTMTWMPAFIVIFIIMMMFLAGVGILNENPLRERPELELGSLDEANIDYFLSYQ